MNRLNEFETSYANLYNDFTVDIAADAYYVQNICSVIKIGMSKDDKTISRFLFNAISGSSSCWINKIDDKALLHSTLVAIHDAIGIKTVQKR